MAEHLPLHLFSSLYRVVRAIVPSRGSFFLDGGQVEFSKVIKNETIKHRRKKLFEPLIFRSALNLLTKQTRFIGLCILVCSTDKYGPEGKWDKSE